MTKIREGTPVFDERNMEWIAQKPFEVTKGQVHFGTLYEYVLITNLPTYFSGHKREFLSGAHILLRKPWRK